MSGPLSLQALDFIATHPFAMVTLEKSSMLHYPPLSNSSGEARLIQQAKWVKQRAPDKAVMFCERSIYKCGCDQSNLACREG